MTTIYVDNAATTKTSRTAIDAMLPYFDKIYGNPSSLHSVGQAAADALRKAREEAAEVLGCEPSEDRKSTRLKSSHVTSSRMPSSA